MGFLIVTVVAISLVVSMGEQFAKMRKGLMEDLAMKLVGSCSLLVGIGVATAFFAMTATTLKAQEADSPKVAFEEPESTEDSPVIDEELTGPAKDSITTTEIRLGRQENIIPSWIPPKEWSGNGIHTSPVTSDPFETETECLHNLDHKIRNAVNEYIDHTLHRPGAGRYLNYPIEYLKQMVVVRGEGHEPRYEVQAREFSIGKMYIGHSALEFRPEFRTKVHKDWNEFVSQSRLWQMGLAGAGIFALLLMSFSYFKLDNATRGFYTGRLQFMGAVLLLGLIAAGAYFAQLIPWL